MLLLIAALRAPGAYKSSEGTKYKTQQARNVQPV